MTILNDKSKLHFQPLLFDSFKYKAPNTTYKDHYKGRMKSQYAFLNRAHAQASQKAKSAALSKSRKPINFVQNNIDLYKKKYEVPVFNDDAYYQEYLRTIVANPQYLDTRNVMVYDDSSARKYVNFNPTVTVNEISKRPESNSYAAYNIQLNVGENIQKLASPPPPTPPMATTNSEVIIENKLRDNQLANLVSENLHLENKYMKDQLISQSMNKENFTEIKGPEAPKVTQSQLHWSVYQQDPTPKYIIDAKKRLGQIKQPHLSPKDAEKPPKSPAQPTSEPKNITELKHWSQFDNPSTPDNIKAIRKRLGDDRYRKCDIVKSKSFTNLSKISLSPAPKSETPTFEQYRIPTINDNVIAKLSNTPDPSESYNLMPVNDDNAEIKNDINTAIKIVERYDETHPSSDSNNERVVYSRTSNESKMSNDSKTSALLKFDSASSSPPLISLDTWMKVHASEKEKESVLRALKYTSNVPHSPSPVPSLQSIKPHNHYNEYVRAQAKNPSPPASSHYRKGSPSIRKLGQTRGNVVSNFNIEDEKKYIRDYLWNANNPAIIKTGYGM